ncbi:MAG: YdcF family protein [Verrucomicrobia bacterium]|nr:YdcF family protein [Verrucomicrobiota bacterium]
MRKQRLVRRRILGAGAVIVGLYLAAACLLCIDGLTDQLGQADVALVLGNKVAPDGTPSPRLAARLDRAADLFRTGNYQWIIVSGGTGKEGYPEGDAMRDYLTMHGVPAASIIVDHLGNNTRASAVNTVTIMRARNWTSAFVITQHFHVPRSELALHKLGVRDVFTAHAHYFEWRDIYSTLREVPAYVKYLLR